VEEADRLRHKQEVKNIYSKRKEPSSGYSQMQKKAWHALDNSKGLKKLTMQAMLSFAALNL
jgi:hypothetical protein